MNIEKTSKNIVQQTPTNNFNSYDDTADRLRIIQEQWAALCSTYDRYHSFRDQEYKLNIFSERLSEYAKSASANATITSEFQCHIDIMKRSIHLSHITYTAEEFKLQLIQGHKFPNAPLIVDGTLDLTDYTLLTSLPNQLRIQGSLCMPGCTSITSLPKGLYVKDCLQLRYCTSLLSLPEDIKVGSWIDLSGCTGLICLPDGLTVQRDLHLSGCTSLNHLPLRLHVKGSLYFHLCGCVNSPLPYDLHVEGDLTSDYCPFLTWKPPSKN